MTLAERLSEYVRAAFSGIWVQSHEHDEAVHEIAQLCRQNDWTLATWDIDRGLSLNGQAAESDAMPTAADPLSAIKALNALATPDGTAILVLRNFHRFLGSAEIVQALDTAIAKGKQDRHLRRRSCRPSSRSRSNWSASSSSSSTTCPVVTNWSRSPAASPPSPATCPRATTWAWSSMRRRA